MASVYIGMLFPLIAFITVLATFLYLLVKTVRHGLSLLDSQTQAKIEQRKLPERHLQAGTT